MTADNDKPSDGDSFDLPGFNSEGGKSSGDSRPERPRYSGGPPKRYPDSGAGRGRPPSLDGGRPSYGGNREGGRPSYGSGGQGDRRDGGRPSYGGGGDRRDSNREGGRPSYGGGGGQGDRRDGGRPQYGGGGGFSGGSRSGGGDRPPRRPGGEGDRPPYNRSGGGDSGGKYGGPRSGGKSYEPRSGGDRPYGGGQKDSRNDSRYGGGGQRDFRPPSAPRSFEPEISAEVSKYLPLKHEKGRYRESRFLIEGAKNIADVVALSPGIIYTVLVAQGFEDEKLKAALNYNRVHTQEVSPRDLAALCDTESPQGVVAVASFGALKPDWATANVVTLIDGVQDPGNLGSILRTSAALGVDAVVLGKGTCDAYNPKVVRGSAAALLRMPLETGEDLGAKIQFLRLKGFSVVATSPHAQITLSQAKLRRKVALLFGNEGAGVGTNFLDQADALVKIPMRGKIESLNVAVAHGLLTYELLRLRDEKP